MSLVDSTKAGFLAFARVSRTVRARSKRSSLLLILLQKHLRARRSQKPETADCWNYTDQWKRCRLLRTQHSWAHAQRRRSTKNLLDINSKCAMFCLGPSHHRVLSPQRSSGQSDPSFFLTSTVPGMMILTPRSDTYPTLVRRSIFVTLLASLLVSESLLLAVNPNLHTADLHARHIHGTWR